MVPDAALAAAESSMILRTLARASSSSTSATPYDALSAGIAKVSSHVPFTLAKKSSPGLTLALRVVRSTPKVPKAGFVTAGGDAGAALPAGVDPPPRQPAASRAAIAATAHPVHFADAFRAYVIWASTKVVVWTSMLVSPRGL